MNREQALKVLANCEECAQLSDLYNDNNDVQEAMHVLFEGFEYPDYSYMTMRRIVRIAG